VVSATIVRIAARAGMLGAVAIGACSVVAGLAYRGLDGEAYSPLNHYVSELGEYGVSALAPVFNAGLLVGGTCFGLFMWGLGEVRGGLVGAVTSWIGAAAGTAGALVGVFSLNTIEVHSLAAYTFFNLGWVAVGLASMDVLARPDPRFPGRLAAVGLATAAAFLLFIAAYAGSASSAGRGLEPSTRRAGFDAVTTLEWASIVGTLVWTFLVAWAWQRGPRTVTAVTR
jgi:hypothetical membrane protein